MSKRVVTSIRIDEEVLQKAKKIGLNISKIAENALIDLIELIEGAT
jgi:post-segregation antitoxin (ccd killing protein)